jgi:hypothetical protein
MAKDRAKLVRRRHIGAKLETSTGVEVTLANADQLEAIDPKLTFDATATRRQGTGLGQKRAVPGIQSGATTFQTEARNAATEPLALSLLRAAGFKYTSGVYSLQGVGDVGDTATVGLYNDGRFKSLAGVMFNLKITGEVGKPVYFEWSGKGKRQIGATFGPRDLSGLTVAPIAGLPPVVKGITLTVGATSICFSKFELDLQNDVQLRMCGTDPTGVYSAQIVARDPQFKLNPEAKGLSVKNWYDDYENGVEAALSIQIGSGTDGTITIAAGKVQLTMPPEEEDESGILRDAITAQCNETAGDDELTITRA